RGVGGANVGIDRNAGVEAAPGRHRGGPVAALDLADVEVDRVVEGLEVPVAALALVPALLQDAQGLDQAVGRLDRVGARARVADVHRQPAYRHLEPQYAAVGTHQ